MTNHEVWDKTIELNGVAIQSVVCMEECSELIKAISKRLRGELDIENNLAEEMADVTICLYQLARMYDVDDTDVHAWIDRKTERQRKRAAGPPKRGDDEMNATSVEWIIGHFADDITAMRTETEKRYGRQPLQTRPQIRMETRIPQEKEGKQ